MKLARQNSVRTFDVGVKRERVVNVNVSDKGRVSLIRYFSEEEMTMKYKRAREEGQEQKYVPPYTSQVLSREACDVLFENRDEVVDVLMRLKSGDELEEEDQVMWKLGRSNECKLYLKVDTDTLTCHIRKYWYDRNDDILRPTQRGVTVNSDEMLNILMSYEQIVEYLNAAHPLQDGPQ